MAWARCYSCKRLRGDEEFAPDPSKSLGRKSICRACDREKARLYYLAKRARAGD